MDQNYFLVGLNLTGRPCWVVGNGAEAEDKAAKLIKAGARLTAVAPKPSTSYLKLIRENKVHHLDRELDLHDLDQQFLVVYCLPSDSSFLRKLYRECQKRKILLCAIDRPEFCDVVNVSLYERGPLKIGISTSGISPALAKRIREGLDTSLKDVSLEPYLSYLKLFRKEIKKSNLEQSQRKERLIKEVKDFEFTASIRLPQKWRK